MTSYLCSTCGTEYPLSERPPSACPICEDERQFVPPTGQRWITQEKLRGSHHNTFFEERPGIWGIVTEPKFAIGQRALLVRAGTRNILWDCVSLVDDETIARVRELGGISAITISHPHYYSSMLQWSRAFDAPIYLHEADREWVQTPDSSIQFWSGETHALFDGATLIRVGGHFAGFQVMHLAEQRSLFTGDLPQVCPDLRQVSFMYSYPNYLPLNAASVRRIVAALEPFAYETLYGAWPHFVVAMDAKEVVRRSAARYLNALQTDR